MWQNLVKQRWAKNSSPYNCPSIEKRKINNNNILKTADMLSVCFILLFHSYIFLLFFICIMFWSGSFPSFLLIYPKLNIYLSLLLFDSPLLSSPSSTIPPLHKDWWYATAASNLSKQLYSSGCNIVVYCCSLSFCHFILEYIFLISCNPPGSNSTRSYHSSPIYCILLYYFDISHILVGCCIYFNLKY